MITRTRTYEYYFDGPTGGVLKVREAFFAGKTSHFLPVREHGLGARKTSVKRLIKVLAVKTDDTVIQLGTDGWSVTIVEKGPVSYCLSNSTKEIRPSSTDTNIAIVVLKDV